MPHYTCISCHTTQTAFLYYEEVVSARMAEYFHSPHSVFHVCIVCMEAYTRQARYNVSFQHCTNCGRMYDTAEPAVCACTHCELCVVCSADHYCDRVFYRSLRAVIGPFERPNRYVGIELEVVDDQQIVKKGNALRKSLRAELPANISIQHDGSVRGKYCDGFEVITPPIRVESPEFASYMTRVVETLKKYKCTINDTCGFHVHFDARDIVTSPERIAHVLRTLYAVEDILFSMNPPSRWKNHFCLPLSSEYLFEDFDTPMPLEKFDQYWYSIGEFRFSDLNRDDIDSFKSSKYGHAKYCGVNFHSLLYRQTIEFRHHAGTLQTEKILEWVTFLHHLIEYACYAYVDADVRALYEMTTSQKKLTKMVDVLHIPKHTAAYMAERIEKFNTQFRLFQTNQHEESLKTQKRISSRRQEIEGLPIGSLRRTRCVPRNPFVTTTTITTLRQLTQNSLEQYYTNVSTNAQFELNHAQHAHHEAMRQQQEAIEQQLLQNVGTDVQRAARRRVQRGLIPREMTESVNTEEDSHA